LFVWWNQPLSHPSILHIIVPDPPCYHKWSKCLFNYKYDCPLFFYFSSIFTSILVFIDMIKLKLGKTHKYRGGWHPRCKYLHALFLSCHFNLSLQCGDCVHRLRLIYDPKIISKENVKQYLWCVYKSSWGKLKFKGSHFLLFSLNKCEQQLFWNFFVHH
jgi:hypothetical protein